LYFLRASIGLATRACQGRDAGIGTGGHTPLSAGCGAPRSFRAQNFGTGERGGLRVSFSGERPPELRGIPPLSTRDGLGAGSLSEDPLIRSDSPLVLADFRHW
jgi:hypothetical protein